MNIIDAIGILPHYDEIMDRQRETKEMESEKRNELITQKWKEYFEDSGTFIEFIQNIEINEETSNLLESIHESMQKDDDVTVGSGMYILFSDYCEELAIEGVDNE